MVYGDAILYDDPRNVNDETWEIIETEIKNRIAKTPQQPQYNNYINLKRAMIKKYEKEDPRSPWIGLTKDFLGEELRYGEYYYFPKSRLGYCGA